MVLDELRETSGCEMHCLQIPSWLGRGQCGRMPDDSVCPIRLPEPYSLLFETPFQ